jgi:2-dehydro-3-deoxyphosphogluconate aldolase / (4S)-4-hydroxy-2-oxoglutarate aldolase
MTRQEVHARIDEIGIIPGIRVHSSKDAKYAAQTVAHAGIPIIEITTTTPGCMDVIAELVKSNPDVIVGAGTVMDVELAQRCIDAGAQFITSPALELKVVEYVSKKNITVFPGALTPTEVMLAWKAGADLVKIFPCAHVGGEAYIRSLKGPFHQVPLIAAGGVNQMTATGFILAGACAIGVGSELIPHEAIRLQQTDRINELARRFIHFVKTARKQVAAAHSERRPTQAAKR